MTARWSVQANADVREIGRYIARDKPRASRAWINRLERKAIDASRVPMLGRIVPEIGRHDVREVFLRSYRIMYRVEEQRIVVVAIVHGSRRFFEVDPDAE